MNNANSISTPTGGLAEGDNQVAAQNQEAAGATVGAGPTPPMTFEQATYQDVAACPANDTLPESQLVGAIRGYRRACQERFKDVLGDEGHPIVRTLAILDEADQALNEHIDATNQPAAA